MKKMGAWGSKLYQNDTALDVKDDFIDHLKCGRDEFEATRLMIQENEFIIDDDDDGPIFWFVLADIQWEYGRLVPEVKMKVLEMIENGEDSELFRETLKGGPNKRKKILQELKDKITSEQPPKKNVKQHKYFKTTWKHGDTYCYQITGMDGENSEYNGRYIILYTIHQEFNEKGDYGDYFPVVYLKITEGIDEPTCLDDVNNATFIRYVYFPGIKQATYRRLYTVVVESKIRKLNYIGNFEIELPNDEYLRKGFREDEKKKVPYDDGYKGERYSVGIPETLSRSSLKFLIAKIDIS